MRAFAAVLAVMSLAFFAGCGDDDDSTSTTTTSGATGASGASGAVGQAATFDGIESCLTDAGFSTAANENEQIGIDAPAERLDIAYEDLQEGAGILIFESAEDAEAEADNAQVAMGVGPTTVAGNTIWGIDASVEEPEELEAGIEGCVPAS